MLLFPRVGLGGLGGEVGSACEEFEENEGGTTLDILLLGLLVGLLVPVNVPESCHAGSSGWSQINGHVVVTYYI